MGGEVKNFTTGKIKIFFWEGEGGGVCEFKVEFFD